MRVDSKHSIPDRMVKLGLIALVVFFSQVYPYVHFHHAHPESEAPYQIGLSPIEAQPDHSHHGHGHADTPHEPSDTHEHNHDFDHHIDWHVVRAHSTGILSHIDFACIAIQVDIDSPTPAPEGRYQFDFVIPAESVLPPGIDTRGPPARG